MMDAERKKTRALRPTLSALEPITLLSAAVHPFAAAGIAARPHQPAEVSVKASVSVAGQNSGRVDLAKRIQGSSRIALASVHVSGVRDNATANQNIRDTAAGRAAQRSRYGTAPGGSVSLSVDMLDGMANLSHRFSFRVSEIAGGSHSRGSRHYNGAAFDVDQIGGQAVSQGSRYVADFMAMARRLGATEVLGPGDPGHSTHVHVAWNR